MTLMCRCSRHHSTAMSNLQPLVIMQFYVQRQPGASENCAQRVSEYRMPRLLLYCSVTVQCQRHTSRLIVAVCWSAGLASELPCSTLLECVKAAPCENETAMDAPHEAANDCASRCFAAKLWLSLQRLRGFRAQSGQNLFSAGQVKCLHMALTTSG